MFISSLLRLVVDLNSVSLNVTDFIGGAEPEPCKCPVFPHFYQCPGNCCDMWEPKLTRSSVGLRNCLLRGVSDSFNKFDNFC